jgi:uncharacterized protein (TIGR00369 family)
LAEAPSGFERFDGDAGFIDLVGPVFVRQDGERRCFGIRIEERHRNAAGFAHGGMLATLVDFALGRAIEDDADDDQARVTVSLTTDYLRPVEVGSWVEVHTDVERLGGTLAFADCSLKVDDTEVVRARAVFAAS